MRAPVHPRVGGERFVALDLSAKKDGSSPRGRGTLHIHDANGPASRFIPAWAGNASRWLPRPRARTVHPRVGGERLLPSALAVAHHGSSPRGRGTLPRGRRSSGRRRFIPAWAGNASRPAGTTRERPVHPRVGGERMLRKSPTTPQTGSSPRGRGTHSLRGCRRTPPRFIPAWAGNAEPFAFSANSMAVHPRVGGERTQRICRSNAVFGSSPRGRGTRDRVVAARVGHRFIPAWAGNALWLRTQPSMLSVHPRVGGERGVRIECQMRKPGSSPRGRGTQRRRAPRGGSQRFIPAWAGNARYGAGRRREPAVHPRVGGERSCW